MNFGIYTYEQREGFSWHDEQRSCVSTSLGRRSSFLYHEASPPRQSSHPAYLTRLILKKNIYSLVWTYQLRRTSRLSRCLHLIDLTCKAYIPPEHHTHFQSQLSRSHDPERTITMMPFVGVYKTGSLCRIRSTASITELPSSLYHLTKTTTASWTCLW